ncbi:MAG TPA: glycosyltransferase family 39 protein [Opitutaceae bacterium]|nr:glycosyltransferase family 39 protein [Opitutaceae bacterium]
MDLFRRRPPVWALILLPVLLWLGQYWQRGLWAPDEARYAYIAREMRDTGEWLVMHVNGGLYPDKPAFLFWLINAASVVTGGEINSLSARLPSLFGMILGLWAIARLAQRWTDAATAWRAVLVTMTSYLVWWEGGWGRIDPLLFGFELAALYHFFSYNDDGRRWRLPAAYLLLGLGTFAKGPVAIPVVLGAYLAATLAGGEGAKLRRWHWAWGVPLALVPIGVWLAAARWIAHGPDEYFAAMFGVKFIGRVAQAANHANPFHYYLTHFPSEFMPWTIFIPAAYLALGPGVLRRRLLAWGLFIIVMFSLFSGKRQMYILAAYPAAALLVAAAWPTFGGLSRRWTSVSGWIATGFVLLVGVVGCAGAVTLNVVPPEGKLGLKLAKALTGIDTAALTWRLAALGVPMLAAGVWLARRLRRERLSLRWFGEFAGTVFALLVIAGAVVLPALNPVKAPLALVPEAQRRLAPGQPIHVYGLQLAIVPYYVERPGRELRRPEEVEAVLTQNASGLIVFVAKDWAELAPRFGERVLAHPLRMGGKRLVWVEFPRPPGAVQEPLELPATAPAKRVEPDDGAE